MIKQLLAILALALAAPALNAATTADRSLFTQGHWWSTQRPGSGFELFHANGQAMAIWYTYDLGGRPVWFTAQGTTDSLGTPWTLYKHRWADGRKAGEAAVGKLNLKVTSPESVIAEFDLGGTRGAVELVPFVQSGTLGEVDHSGSWFDPAQSGWGITVTEQGDVLGGVLYTYDPSGEPTWLAGFDRGRRDVELHSYTGPCASCGYNPAVSRSAGRLTFDFASETQLTLRNGLSTPMAAGVTLEGARLTQIARPASSRAADRTLVALPGEAALRAYIEKGMFNRNYGVSGGIDFSPAPPSGSAPASSGTNLQEAGVDEADLVKSDGRYVYTFAHDAITRQRRGALRVAEVTGDGGAVSVLGELALNPQGVSSTQSSGLFLHGDRLAAIIGNAANIQRSFPYSTQDPTSTHIEIFDVKQRAQPVSLLRLQVEGTVLTSRRIGDRMYVVSRFIPLLAAASDSRITREARLALAATTPLADLLPKMRVNGGVPVNMVDPSSIYLPPQGTQPPQSDFMVVTEIDLATPRVVKSLAIAGALEAIYVSPSNLYLVTSRAVLRTSLGTVLNPPPPYYISDIHQVRLATSGMSIAGSGTVEGYFGVDLDKGAFRMSEHEGRLRVVTGAPGSWWGASSYNRLTVLEFSPSAGGVLKTVAYIPNATRPERIGKPNELLYGVRFLGDRLYAVTFQKTDPLYVIDLSSPTDPRIAGALEVPGFSDYLHPLGNGLLLGFGLDAIPAGGFGDAQFAWFQGLQITLFDVSDASRPREIQRLLMGKRGSDSALLRSHHAFSALARPDGSTTVAIPARLYDGIGTSNSPTQSYPYQESSLLRFEVRGTTPTEARLRQMSSLVFDRSNPYTALDPGYDGGRSIQFANGTIFVGNGSFWRQDNQGLSFGPY